MKFVTKSLEEPDNVKKARIVTFNIFIPPYLLTNNMSGPMLKKKWKDFVSNRMIHLFHTCGIISDAEMKRMSDSQMASLWDGRIESLLTANKSALRQIQKSVEEEISKHPVGSITSNEEERNHYLVRKYQERLAYMKKNNQIIPDGLTDNEQIYGMKRLMDSLFFSSAEYHLENPLWQFVVIHLHKGDYSGITKPSDDNHFHIYIPYMFDERELSSFMKNSLSQLQMMTKGKSVEISIK